MVLGAEDEIIQYRNLEKIKKEEGSGYRTKFKSVKDVYLNGKAFKSTLPAFTQDQPLKNLICIQQDFLQVYSITASEIKPFYKYKFGNHPEVRGFLAPENLSILVSFFDEENCILYLQNRIDFDDMTVLAIFLRGLKTRRAKRPVFEKLIKLDGSENEQDSGGGQILGASGKRDCFFGLFGVKRNIEKKFETNQFGVFQLRRDGSQFILWSFEYKSPQDSPTESPIVESKRRLIFDFSKNLKSELSSLKASFKPQNRINRAPKYPVIFKKPLVFEYRKTHLLAIIPSNQALFLALFNPETHKLIRKNTISIKMLQKNVYLQSLLRVGSHVNNVSIGFSCYTPKIKSIENLLYMTCEIRVGWPGAGNNVFCQNRNILIKVPNIWCSDTKGWVFNQEERSFDGGGYHYKVYDAEKLIRIGSDYRGGFGVRLGWRNAKDMHFSEIQGWMGCLFLKKILSLNLMDFEVSKLNDDCFFFVGRRFAVIYNHSEALVQNLLEFNIFQQRGRVQKVGNYCIICELYELTILNLDQIGANFSVKSQFLFSELVENYGLRQLETAFSTFKDPATGELLLIAPKNIENEANQQEENLSRRGLVCIYFDREMKYKRHKVIKKSTRAPLYQENGLCQKQFGPFIVSLTKKEDNPDPSRTKITLRLQDFNLKVLSNKVIINPKTVSLEAINDTTGAIKVEKYDYCNNTKQLELIMFKIEPQSKTIKIQKTMNFVYNRYQEILTTQLLGKNNHLYTAVLSSGDPEETNSQSDQMIKITKFSKDLAVVSRRNILVEPNSDFSMLRNNLEVKVTRSEKIIFVLNYREYKNGYRCLCLDPQAKKITETPVIAKEFFLDEEVETTGTRGISDSVSSLFAAEGTLFMESILS